MDSESLNRSLYFPVIPGLGGIFSQPPKYDGIFTNESKDHNNLRTKSVQGRFTHLPKIGERFSIVGESLTPGGTLRYINTSLVTMIDSHLPGQVIVFQTENSKYRLDYTPIKED